MTYNFDTTLTLYVESDGAGNVELRYDVLLGHRLWPNFFGTNAGLGALSVATTLAGATPGQGINMADPSAIGQHVSPYLEGEVLPLSVSRGTIGQTTLSVTPTSFEDVDFNLSGDFNVDFVIAPSGAPQFFLDASSCDFTVQGTAVSLPVGGCASNADCDDGNACTLNACVLGLSRCQPALDFNDGGACDPGTGSADDGQCSQGICRLKVGCSINGTLS